MLAIGDLPQREGWNEASRCAFARDSKNATSRPGLGHRAESLDERRRTLTSEALEIPHHMHLVVVADLLGDIRPEACRRRNLRFERSLKPDDLRVAFGRKANPLGEASLELPDT